MMGLVTKMRKETGLRSRTRHFLSAPPECSEGQQILERQETTNKAREVSVEKEMEVLHIRKIFVMKNRRKTQEN